MSVILEQLGEMVPDQVKEGREEGRKGAGVKELHPRGHTAEQTLVQLLTSADTQ